MKSVMNDMNKGMSDLRVNIAQLEKELDKAIKVQCLRNVVVCGVGMALLCYYFFFA